MKHLTLVLFTIFLCWIQFSHSVQITATYDKPEIKTVQFDLKLQFSLSCNTSEEVTKIVWKKNNETFPASQDDKRIKITTSKTSSKLEISRSQEDDAGSYTCHAFGTDNTEAEAKINAICKIAVKVQSNINVVEGEKLRILCNVIGKPSPTISWTFSNETHNQTFTKTEGRIQIEDDDTKKIANAVLKIEAVDMFDRGTYTCIGKSEENMEDDVTSTCMIRIKDKYAALWPFLGICAEVFILCAIIFIYEKKRNKTELDESDTDQSPDQKNTPDHGKDSNLRHRQ